MKSTRRSLRIVTALFAVLCMVMAMAVPVLADNGTSNGAVTADRDGILQVRVVYTNDNNVEYTIQSGTGFLINDTTIITCNHVVHVDDETMEAIQKTIAQDKTYDKILKKLKVVINVNRDVEVDAKIYKNSEEVDYAVLQLTEGKLETKRALPLRKTVNVDPTEECYALGFPWTVGVGKTFQTYTSSDVTITSGQVNKIGQFVISGSVIDYVVNSAAISSGNSGGPLVDTNGNVIGIVQGTFRTDQFDPQYGYAIAIDQIMETLDILGVEYTPATAEPEPEPVESVVESSAESVVESVAEPTPEPVDFTALNNTIDEAGKLSAEDYNLENESYKAALSEAQEVAANASATQEEIDEAAKKLSTAMTDPELKKVEEPKPGGLNPLVIAAIAAALLLAIILIVLLTRKPKQPTYTPPVNTPPTPPVPPVPPVSPGQTPPPAQFNGYRGGNETSILSNAGETTVLNQGSNETTVLNSNRSYGSLIRNKTRETITISKASFRIGRERSKVDYCVSDNTAVGRLHAIIVSKNGESYIVDQDSTNGTSVNDVKASPRVETKLRNGDKISLADEEFTFNAL